MGGHVFVCSRPAVAWCLELEAAKSTVSLTLVNSLVHGFMMKSGGMQLPWVPIYVPRAAWMELHCCLQVEQIAGEDEDTVAGTTANNILPTGVAQ